VAHGRDVEHRDEGAGRLVRAGLFVAGVGWFAARSTFTAARGAAAR
jgi:hypothetical protein